MLFGSFGQTGTTGDLRLNECLLTMFVNLVTKPGLLKWISAKGLSTTAAVKSKVAILGASGGIGQPLCLLLKQNPLVTELSMYDVLHSPGVAADLSHINTPCVTRGYGPGELGDALKGAAVVLVAAGQPRKAAQSQQDHFLSTSRIIKDLSVSCARENPNAIYGLISHPVISSVPLLAAMFQKAGVLDPNKILGVTTLGGIRASTFVAEEKKMKPGEVVCPVIGGHSGVTIIPVLSQCKPSVDIPMDRAKILTRRIREAGTEVFEAKFGTGAVTLSMSYAGAQFTFALLRAIQGEKNVVESVYVRSDVTSAKYFANQVVLGPNGVEKNLGIGTLNAYEQELLDAALPELKKSIEAGEEYAARKI